MMIVLANGIFSFQCKLFSFLLTILENFVQWTQRGSNTEIMIGSEIDDIVKELFESFLQRYREELE